MENFFSKQQVFDLTSEKKQQREMNGKGRNSREPKGFSEVCEPHNQSAVAVGTPVLWKTIPSRTNLCLIYRSGLPPLYIASIFTNDGTSSSQTHLQLENAESFRCPCPSASSIIISASPTGLTFDQAVPLAFENSLVLPLARTKRLDVAFPRLLRFYLEPPVS
ncbi:hypothetical protein P153DRAFT_361802 [Dothidotthia symphoricarpi CBS 119687]|uniref:Uncharacterized protein n=1 Tax=Dothidotthia symphoricarpi CBS 119687 TaxID=1392245 RepID=A0A6A5ZWK2_9PLEO|nr:uncharacterized protein P153DRAFT_361802 [Dothidotthia symphoricarpi CBS 119687]KAF2123676.1 hypothetical protein P153DRAFT_361802 [Dothidotthia symphoricarpi CBS 119687]